MSDPCFTFYLCTPMARRPIAFTLLNGDVRFAILAPEPFTVKARGVAVIHTGVRIKVPPKLAQRLTWARPDWMPGYIELQTIVEEKRGDIVVRLYNPEDLPLQVGLRAWLIIGYVDRQSWWDHLFKKRR